MHVDVAGVVELAAAELAHADHGQPGVARRPGGGRVEHRRRPGRPGPRPVARQVVERRAGRGPRCAGARSRFQRRARRSSASSAGRGARPARRGRRARRGRPGRSRAARVSDCGWRRRPRPPRPRSGDARRPGGREHAVTARQPLERRPRTAAGERRALDERLAGAIGPGRVCQRAPTHGPASARAGTPGAVPRLRVAALPAQHGGRRSRRQRRPHPRRPRARPRPPGCDLAVFPELAITGYPPEDLLLKPGFVGRQPARPRPRGRRAPAGARPWSASSTPAATCYNAAAVCADGEVPGVVPQAPPAQLRRVRRAALLRPGHRRLAAVRDRPACGSACRSARTPGAPTGPIADAGRRRRRADRQPQRLALLRRPAGRARAHAGHPGRRRRRARSSTSTRSAARTSWSSTARRSSFDADGELVARAPPVRRGRSLVVDLEVQPVFRKRLLDPRGRATAPPLPGRRRVVAAPGSTTRPTSAAGASPTPLPPVARGLRGAGARHPRLRRTRTASPTSCIGLSGGIDSSLVAAIAVDALGPEHVHGVLDAVALLARPLARPTPRSWPPTSASSCRTIADRAGPRRLPRHAGPVASTGLDAGPHRGEPPVPHPGRGADGAVQQVRGWLVLTTGNKSEMAVGYSTLYGDTAGGFAVIKDVPKTARLRAVPRPQRRGPGASSSPRRCSPSRRRPSCGPTSATTSRCRPTRCSTRSSRPTSRTTARAAELVGHGLRRRRSSRRITRLVDLAEYKRRQTPPGRAGDAQGVRQGPPPADHQPLPRLNPGVEVPRRAAGPGRGRPVRVARRARRRAMLSPVTAATSRSRRRPGGPVRLLRRAHHLAVAARSRATADGDLDFLVGPYHEDTDHPWHRLERGEITIEEWIDRHPGRGRPSRVGRSTSARCSRCSAELTVHDDVVAHIRGAAGRRLPHRARHQQRARGLGDVAGDDPGRRPVRRRGRQLGGRHAQARPGDLSRTRSTCSAASPPSGRCSSTTSRATSSAPAWPGCTRSSSTTRPARPWSSSTCCSAGPGPPG